MPKNSEKLPSRVRAKPFWVKIRNQPVDVGGISSTDSAIVDVSYQHHSRLDEETGVDGTGFESQFAKGLLQVLRPETRSDAESVQALQKSEAGLAGQS